MTRRMDKEADIRRLFREHGLQILTIRRNKHWVITAARDGVVGSFVMGSSPSDYRVERKIRAQLRRGTGARTGGIGT